LGQAHAVKRREIVIPGIEHKRVQLAAANADIAAGEKRQRHSVLKQTGERQFVAITVDAYNLREIGNDPYCCFRSEHLGVDSELEGAWRSLIERAACMPAQHPHSLDRRLRVASRNFGLDQQFGCSAFPATSVPEQFPDCSLNPSVLLGALRPELRRR
jgi:hypothetical protein